VHFFVKHLQNSLVFSYMLMCHACTVSQVDQGLGIGSKFPFFNRHQVTLTRFIQLQQEDQQDAEKPPLVAVVHGRYGGCIGDLASYDAFTLGGPYSVRGYNMGELGAARNFLEVRSRKSKREY
jgi:outer membrane protein assembly factor BamA